MHDTINFEIFDVSGGVFNVRVTKREANALDHGKNFVILLISSVEPSMCAAV